MSVSPKCTEGVDFRLKVDKMSIGCWTKLKLVIAMFSDSKRLQRPKSLTGVDCNGIRVWRYRPSTPTEYNHMNHGWVAEQSTAEEMKDAWVVVAIVHLIRTEVLIQSEQTQEVILI